MDVRHALDWSPYEHYGEGDAFASIPRHGGALGRAAAVCIGNRACQKTGPGLMCPSYRVTADPAHSTHARASTLKAALNGELGPNPFAGPELADAMALCVGCKGCKRDCPNGVDASMLKLEVTAQRWLHHPVPMRERLFASLPQMLHRHARWMALAVRLREVIPGMSRILERLLGISAQRSLPRPSRRSFFDQVARLNPVPGSSVPDNAALPEVVLWIDTFSNHFDPAIAEAAVKVLASAGRQVILARPADGDSRPLCCGRTALSGGFVEQARAELQRTLAALVPYAQRGVPIVGLEPSCLLTLRDEALRLGLGEDAQVVAGRALLIEEFIAREVQARRFELPLSPWTGGKVHLHGHCHQKAFGTVKALRKMLSLVPGLDVEVIESSCCGMAGSFGLEAEHVEVSRQMAELALLPAVRAAAPDDHIVASGTSCRTQIHEWGERAVTHPVQILAAQLVPPQTRSVG